jgi:hypothetical protein
VEKIKRQHEDAVVEELRIALPHVHLKEIRRLVKEFGDGEKVLEFLTGVDSKSTPPQLEPISTDLPNGIPTPEEQSQDPLSTSMEILSLNSEPTEPSTPEEPTVLEERIPPSFSTDVDNPKHKARQRRQESAARKEKNAKRAQKEAAKRRKRMEAMGMEKMDDTTSTSAQEHILKAIVI